MKYKLLCLCALLISCLAFDATAAGTYVMTGANVVGQQGGIAQLPVKFYNTQPVRDFHLKLNLPEGITIQTDANSEYVIDINSDVAPYYTATANQTNGIYDIIINTQKDPSVLSNNQVLFTLPLVLGAEIGEYEYEFGYIDVSQDIDGTVSDLFLAAFGGSITIEEAVEIADYQFYNPTLFIEEGSAEAQLSVNLNNMTGVKEFLLDIELPDGIAPIYNADADDYVDYGDRIPSRFDVTSTLTGSTLSVDGATTRSTSIDAGDGEVFFMTVNVNLPAGKYPIKYTNQSLVLSDGSSVTAPDFTGYIIVQSPVRGINLILYEDKALDGATPTNTVAKDGSAWRANKIEIKDAAPLNLDYTFTADEVEYTRDFGLTIWQPLYLPFNLSYDEWSALGDVAELVDAGENSNGEYVLQWRTLTSGSIEPNRPYIFKPKAEGQYTFTATDKTFTPTDDTNTIVYSANGSTFTLDGVYMTKSDMFTTGAYGIAPDGNFKRVTSNAVMLKPMRIYLTITTTKLYTPNMIMIRVDDQTTNIEGLEIDFIDNSQYYDLNGRNVVKASKGIYIKDNQKIYINK